MPGLAYLNVDMKGLAGSSTAERTPASQLVDQNGDILDDVTDYYVSVQRLRMTMDIPLTIAPVKLPDFTEDGVSSAWSLTIRYTAADGTETDVQVPIKFQKTAAAPPTATSVILGQVAQPADYYASFETLSEWRDALTQCVQESYAELRTVLGGGILDLADTPFFALDEPGSGKLKVILPSYLLWEQGERAEGAAGLDLFFNWEAEQAMNGFDYIQVTREGYPISETGTDFKIIARSDGTNYDPANASGEKSITPSGAIAGYQLVIPQISPCFTMPGISRVAVITTMPVIASYVPSEAGKATERTLTDFAPDLSTTVLGDNKSFMYYNSAIGDTRWIKLSGGGPLTTFSIRVVTEDYMGVVRPFTLNGQGAVVGVKLCFAPLSLVQNYM